MQQFNFIFVIAILLLASSKLQAASIEKLVMPGKLIQGHAKYENDCEKCHESFKKSKQRQRCLDCHEKIADDITKKSRFHGVNKSASSVACNECHSDHLGRDADVVLLNKDLFPHADTNFKLDGRHLVTACHSCHKPEKKYRDTPHTCIDCHEKQDRHEKKLGKDCAKCHNAKGWAESKFSHDKTDYPLAGKHKEVSCSLCHPANQYADISHKCIDCHRLNDTHQGKYGDKCDKCHNPARWDKSSFNHDKTDFPLKGAHKPAKCHSCHIKDLKAKLKTGCFDCHEKQDKHKGDFGKSCKNCHNEEAWNKSVFAHDKYKKERCYSCHKKDDEHQLRYSKKCEDCHKTQRWDKQHFDHKKDTGYPLTGKHRDVSCLACHKGKASDEKNKTRCVQCHAIDDVHVGKQGDQCQQCHQEAGWSKEVKFDHDMSHFPLIGMHASTACSECHLSARYRDTKSACYSCHKKDDEHKETLTHACAQCHNPNSWRFWQFDHDKQTDFKLTGKHKKLHCNHCHKTAYTDKIRQSGSCVACHRADDEHNGRFGNQCDQCHETTSFEKVNINP